MRNPAQLESGSRIGLSLRRSQTRPIGIKELPRAFQSPTRASTSLITNDEAATLSQSPFRVNVQISTPLTVSHSRSVKLEGRSRPTERGARTRLKAGDALRAMDARRPAASGSLA